MLNSALLIAVLGMCWCFFGTKEAYIMSIILIKSIRKFGPTQETFSLESDFKLGSFLTLMLTQPHQQLCRLSRGCDNALQKVVGKGSSAWQEDKS